MTAAIIIVAVIVLALMAFLVWKAFIRDGRKENARLKERVRELDRQVGELSRSRLNVSEISPILHVAVLNVDTNFVRTFVREEDGLIFNGALRADICAEYGIRMEEVMCRYDKDSTTLYLANFKPGIIGFSRKQLSWEIAHSYRSRKVLGMKLPPVTDKAAEVFTKKMCEDLRQELEQEIDSRNVAEFEWLAPLVSREVTEMLKLTSGVPGLKVVITDGKEKELEGYVAANAISFKD